MREWIPEGCDISNFFWLLCENHYPSSLIRLNNYEVQFFQKAIWSNSRSVDSVCTHPCNCWIIVVKGCYPRFHSSMSQWGSWSTWKLQRTGLILQASHQAENSSILVLEKNICEAAIEAVPSILLPVVYLFKEQNTWLWTSTVIVHSVFVHVELSTLCIQYIDICLVYL